MQSNAELAKRLHALEPKLENESSKLTDDILGQFLLKLQSSGLDAVELKKQVENLETSMGVLNDIIETLRDEKLKLTADKKSSCLKAKHLWDAVPIEGRIPT